MYPAAHPLYFGAELPTFENSNSFVFDVLPPTPTHTPQHTHGHIRVLGPASKIYIIDYFLLH